MAAPLAHAVIVIVVLQLPCHVGDLHHVEPLTAILAVVIGLAITGDGVIVIVHGGVGRGIPVVKAPVGTSVRMGAGILMAALFAHAVFVVVVLPLLCHVGNIHHVELLTAVPAVVVGRPGAGDGVIAVVHRGVGHGIPVVKIPGGIRIRMGTGILMAAPLAHAVFVVPVILFHVDVLHRRRAQLLATVIAVLAELARAVDHVGLVIHGDIGRSIPVVHAPGVIRGRMGAGVLMTATLTHAVFIVVVFHRLGHVGDIHHVEPLAAVIAGIEGLAVTGDGVVHVVHGSVGYGIPIVKIPVGIRVLMGTVRQTDRGQGQNHDQGQKRRKQFFLHKTYPSV